MNIEEIRNQFNPAVPKEWLLLIAGVLWTGVSLMLLNYAITWLTHPISMITILLGLLGVLISIFANHGYRGHPASKFYPS
jgi:hypothetical protein